MVVICFRNKIIPEKTLYAYFPGKAIIFCRRYLPFTIKILVFTLTILGKDKYYYFRLSF
jgi:hypothetical protein